MSARLPTHVWYLALDSPEALRPARDPGPHVTVARAEVPTGALNAFFYTEVGRDYHWIDRLVWSREQWQAYAARAELETWLVWDRGTPAGYAELAAQWNGAQHVAMFGLLDGMRGRGLGGHLLTRVVQRGWERGATEVTLNTCELDGEHALANYRARGFEVVGEADEPRGRLEVRD